ncbi:hypothetical protein CC1G_04084 [Coprinopsis cinerea okayama7|uniref:Uncharacterized protein n=1 Tax=Coprinopsis cinerea (strain Okayama-7 / 130 / ATCC MYA-4618 / FGSC 9003) TaxID=240176 RepID=A8NVX0_COPC7|nr:hypothetical protein CC1G_04084 [Coprinopsis cinerea okayama7\|eukprot:XP_001836771.2 hypothetical protein CC1G_04084 [Coprinopsis cinerea okayama7\
MPELFADIPTGQTTAQQQHAFLRIHAPFYRAAAHTGEGPLFLFMLYRQYRGRWPVDRDQYPSLEEWTRANDVQEIIIKKKMAWLRMTSPKVVLPVSWRELINLRPSERFGEIAADILGKLGVATCPRNNIVQDKKHVKRTKTSVSSVSSRVASGSGTKEDPYVLESALEISGSGTKQDPYMLGHDE